MTQLELATPSIGSITLLVKDQYGHQVLHPNCSTSKHFADIAGTKTITPQALRHILALGYEVEYVHTTPAIPA